MTSVSGRAIRPSIDRLIRVTAAVCALGLLSSCGLRSTKHQDQRAGDASAPAAATSLPTDSQAASQDQAPKAEPSASPESAATVGGSGAVATDSLNHSFDSFFFQAYAVLADLFSTGDTSGESMLCFPAALAYQAEYRRFHADARESNLPAADAKPVTDAEHGAKSIRFYADFCAADLKRGMTVPQGMACIDKIFQTAKRKSNITVIGQDAQWAAFGMLPDNTRSELHAVVPDDVRRQLDDDQSVIALVGAYEKTSAGIQRVKGHFVSITGYVKDASGSAPHLKIEIVDPSADYRDQPEGERFNQASLVALTTTQKVGLPQYVGYSLSGLDIGADDAMIVLESIVTFK